LIVTGVPIGGDCVSGICASAGWPAFVWLSVLVSVIGLPAPVIAISTLTSTSSFSPWLVNLTSNVRPAPAGIRLTAGDGCSVTPPIETESSPCPCVPGAGVPLAVRPPTRALSLLPTYAGLSHARLGRKLDVAICWPPMSLSSSVCLMYGMTRWE
jgi:hypothetical protein